MKLINPVYINDKRKKEFIKELNLTLNIIYQCSCLIIRKDNVDYILKDRWQDPYISEEENIKALSNKYFLIISKQLLARINNYARYGEIIYAGDNLIIQI